VFQPTAVIGRSSPKDVHCRKMIVSAVGDYLAACADDEAALLVAEDVHWFDPSSLEVLGTVLRGGTGRLMVVATGREFH
jgi:predicted ATPase